MKINSPSVGATNLTVYQRPHPQMVLGLLFLYQRLHEIIEGHQNPPKGNTDRTPKILHTLVRLFLSS
jgi:hypothetical protein